MVRYSGRIYNHLTDALVVATLAIVVIFAIRSAHSRSALIEASEYHRRLDAEANDIKMRSIR